jgi:SHS2 domain-containing protein
MSSGGRGGVEPVGHGAATGAPGAGGARAGLAWTRRRSPAGSKVEGPHGLGTERGPKVPYRWIEHTGELELELEASSEQGVFEAGFEAMRELMGASSEGDRIVIPVALPGRDRAALVADWLGELAFLGETRGLVPDRLSEFELDEDGLRATVSGRRGRPSHLVKGATYHRLRFEPVANGWRALVVLDV